MALRLRLILDGDGPGPTVELLHDDDHLVARVIDPESGRVSDHSCTRADALDLSTPRARSNAPSKR